ncbi:alkane 1-monooxygenase [Shimia biformata]|uniref:alkane 1-monooxygenase n=1 Tax=Shimia biformata TaxID=1294299 RepID=UPI00194E9709|nr:alkane 1-monooxygenase [Shimia biformata]
MIWFTLATLAPVILLTLAGLLGGGWSLAALIYMTAFTYLMDRLAKGAAARSGADGEFPSGHTLSVLLGLAHPVLLALAVAALGHGTRGLTENIALFLGFGLFFGQVSNSNAHELIHRSAKWPRRLGKLVYITLLFGHHASAHVRVHHVHVATDKDPNSARRGEGFYHFWPRAWIGSFTAGLRAETALRSRASTSKSTLGHPYVAYVGGAALTVFAAYAIAGTGGIAALLALAIYAQMQLMLSDYVQHYGLRRETGEDGKPEPVGPGHSWNTPHFWSSALMLNAPRHSDHHIRPSRSYPSLELDPATMPVLPRSLPVMGAMAMLPPLWKRTMNRRLDRLGGSLPNPPETLD